MYYLTTCNSRNVENDIEKVLRNLLSPDWNIPTLPNTFNAANSSKAKTIYT